MSSNAKTAEAAENSRPKSEAAPHRPPYHNDTDEKVYHKGRCYCGNVQWTLHQDRPMASKFCHCNTCQRIHGAVYQWATVFPKDKVSFTEGVSHLRFFHHANTGPSDCTWEYELPAKVSAACCGTYIMDEGRSMLMIFPGALELTKEQKYAWRTEKAMNGERPCHIFYGERSVDVRDGLEKWDGLDGKSNKMEEEAMHIENHPRGKERE